MNLKKLEKCLRVNLLGQGHRLIKKNLPGRGLTNVEKHCLRIRYIFLNWKSYAIVLTFSDTVDFTSQL